MSQRQAFAILKLMIIRAVVRMVTAWNTEVRNRIKEENIIFVCTGYDVTSEKMCTEKRKKYGN